MDVLTILYYHAVHTLCYVICLLPPPPPPPPPCHSGHFGLWLDEDFLHGSSYNCETYGNHPLATTEDFLCTGIEAWGFGPGDS